MSVTVFHLRVYELVETRMRKFLMILYQSASREVRRMEAEGLGLMSIRINS
jgi:hypothetical protein